MDVIGLPFIHTEVKRTNVTNINDFISQAKRDNDLKKDTPNVPVVFYKRDRKPWLAVMDLDDWFEFYEEWLKTK